MMGKWKMSILKIMIGKNGIFDSFTHHYILIKILEKKFIR